MRVATRAAQPAARRCGGRLALQCPDGGTLPVVVAYVVAELGRKCWPRLYNALNSVPAIVTVLVVIVAWWVLRNVMGW